MTEHRSEHEVLLAEALSGERRATDPEVAALLAGCAACRERWSALQAVSARLDEAAGARRADLAQLGRGAPAPGEERVLATMQRLALEEPQSRRKVRRPLVAAAAVLLVAALLVRAFLGGGGDGPGGLWLGPKPLHLIAPRGKVDAFERFQWTYDGEAAAFDLRIYAEDADGRELQHEIHRWKETTWSPEAEVLRSLPARIVWQVDALDDSGKLLDSGEASARLSSR